MPTLKERPLLSDFQKYVLEMCQERGWDKRSPLEKMLFLTEEIGEIAKAIRKEHGIYGYEKPENTDHLAGELIDAFNYIIDLANHYEIDLEQAFRKNWQKNATRTWHTPTKLSQ